MKALEIQLGRVTLRNPVLGASGCTGHGYELAAYTDLSRFGAVSLKTFTAEPRLGNRPQRVVEVHSGVLNSIGLQNPGKDIFFTQVMPQVLDVLDQNQIVVSIGGNTVDEYVALCRETEDRFGKQISVLEINAACPNVTHGAGWFSRDPKAAHDLVKSVRNAVSLPIFVKFNTNFESFLDTAAAIEDGGADALYTTNTPLGMRIDWRTQRPMIGNERGPVCGPAIRPIGVLRTWDLYRRVKLPIISSGGICTWEDALEYVLAGASAVGIGSAQFVNPDAVSTVLSGLETYFNSHDELCWSELIGAAHR